MLCPNCSAENAATRRFCAQCGTMLPLACAFCGFVNEPAARFCGGCGRPTGTSAAAPAPPRTDTAERRQLTVMFCDLVGSTALAARLDPEDMREVIGAYHGCVAATIGRFDGFVAKFMGDGVLAYFGYPQAHEDDAERAVGAALALIDAVRRLPGPERLEARVGLATGLAVVGELIGAGSAQERAVVGETPNLAARLQALAGPGQIVISEGTRRQVGELFEYANLGEVALKGLAAPVLVFQVLRESWVRSRFEALRTGQAPLVGREEELALLGRRWRQAKAGDGRVVCIAAEPGIGKSRLVEAFRASLRSEPHTRLRYFCAPQRQDSALYPFIGQLRRAAGFARDDMPRARLEKLEAVLAENAPADGDVPLLAELLSIPVTPRYPALELIPQHRKQRTSEALMRQFTGLAGRQPLMIIFEDLHWADPSSRELLDLSVERIVSMPVLLLVTARPEFQPPWRDAAHVTRMPLRPLRQDESGRLVRGLIGDVPALSREMVDEIVARTDGVPLFLEELTKAVLEAAAAGGDASATVASVPANPRAVPATLHGSLMARLDRLGPTAKEVAQVGAAIGRNFSYRLLALAAGRTEAELLPALGLLAEAGLVFQRGAPPQAMFLFKHALVQDAAYGTLLRGQRLDLHARIGSALEEQFPEIVDAQPEIPAHHFASAGLADRAIAYWRRAGLRSAGRSAHAEAAAHYRSALELLATLPPGEQRDADELDLTLALAVPLTAASGFGAPEVEQCGLRATSLSDRLRGSPSRFAARRLAWNSCLMRQTVPRTVAAAHDLMDLADHDKDPAKRALAHRALGYSLFTAGEFRQAEEALDCGAALADVTPAREFAAYGEHPSMICRAYGGEARIMRGFPDSGLRLVEAAVAIARREENAHSLGWALAAGARISQIQQEPAATSRFASEAMAVARQHRLPQWLGLSEQCMGWAMHRLGAFAAGLELLQQGTERWQETGAMLHTTHRQASLADCHLRMGQIAAAREHLDRARAHRESFGEDYLAAEIDRMEALLLQAEQAPIATVEEFLRASLDTARRQGARLFELRTATTFAGVLAGRGERQVAADLLALVHGWFTEGFETSDLRAAKALLDELG